jgi:hypothetical protein
MEDHESRISDNEAHTKAIKRHLDTLEEVRIGRIEQGIFFTEGRLILIFNI